MLITTLLVAGSVAFVGVKAATANLRRKPALQTHPAQDSQSSAVTVRVIGRTRADGQATGSAGDPQEVAERNKAKLTERRYRAVAATSFWLSLGGVLFQPLTVVSIPLTVYSTIPILESGARSLFGQGQIRPSVINSALIVTTLLTDNYLPAAALTWLHHTARQMSLQAQEFFEMATSEVTRDLGDLASQAMGNSPRTVWKVNENVEVQTPFSELQIGDVIIASQGEFVPVDGTVVAGAATVNMVLRNGVSTPMAVGEGDHVYARMFVTEGRIRVKITQFAHRSQG